MRNRVIGTALLTLWKNSWQKWIRVWPNEWKVIWRKNSWKKWIRAWPNMWKVIWRMAIQALFGKEGTEPSSRAKAGALLSQGDFSPTSLSLLLPPPICPQCRCGTGTCSPFLPTPLQRTSFCREAGVPARSSCTCLEMHFSVPTSLWSKCINH